MGLGKYLQDSACTDAGGLQAVCAAAAAAGEPVPPAAVAVPQVTGGGTGWPHRCAAALTPAAGGWHGLAPLEVSAHTCLLLSDRGGTASAGAGHGAPRGTSSPGKAAGHGVLLSWCSVPLLSWDLVENCQTEPQNLNSTHWKTALRGLFFLNRI